MTDQQDPQKEQYDRAREAFEDLKIEDKTVFLIKESVNTVAQSVEHVVRSLADELGSFFGGEPSKADEAAEAEDATETAEKTEAKPKTSSRKRSTSTKARSTTTKKTTTRKSTTRKKTPPKTDDT